MASAVILMPAQFTVQVDTMQVECQVSEAPVKFDAAKFELEIPVIGLPVLTITPAP